MPFIGCRNPFAGKYNNNNNGTISYTDPISLGRLVQFAIEPESAQDSSFYSDDGKELSDTQFPGGRLRLRISQATPEVLTYLLGLKTRALSNVEGVTDENAVELVYDDSQEAPELGVGLEVWGKWKDKTTGKVKEGWQAIFLRRVMFSNPSESVETKGQTVNWQTMELEADIMQDESATREWKNTAEFTTEAQALAYIKDKVGFNAQAGS